MICVGLRYAGRLSMNRSSVQLWSKFRRFPTLMTFAAVGALSLGLTQAADATTPVPKIIEVAPLAAGGGGFYGWHETAFTGVRFNGGASSSASDYEVTLADQTLTTAKVPPVTAVESNGSAFEARFDLTTMQDGHTYVIRVVEYPHTSHRVTSAPYSWTLHNVQHPSAMAWVQRNTLVTPDMICVGKLVTMTQNGTWGSTTVEEHVWASPSSTNPDAAADNNPSGSNFIVGKPDQIVRQMTWTVPVASAGRWIWIIFHGFNPNDLSKIEYQYVWTPARAVVCHVPIWGTVTGTPRVGRTVTLGAPRVPGGSRTTYRWRIGSKFVTSTSRSYRFLQSQLGKTVSVDVDVFEPGNQHYLKVYRVGSVSR